MFPVPEGRKEKFPEGESLDDLRDRARQAVKELIFPIIRDAVKEEKEGVHVALVSHGLCISELVAAVVGLDYERRSKGLEVPDRQYAGLRNTGWTRATIDLAVCTLCRHFERLMSNELRRMSVRPQRMKTASQRSRSS
jgi:broad specificity phosphatase PhoE